MKIILITAKAQHGKDTVASLLKEELELKGKKVLITHYADLLKYICRTFFNWNGEKDEIGRSILQHVGTDIIRNQNPNYWVEFIADFLELFKDEWDYVIIPDTRFPNEVDKMRLVMGEKNVIALRITRPNFDNGLTEEQNNHSSEIALDNYRFFDRYIINDKTVVELNERVKLFINDLLGEE